MEKINKRSSLFLKILSFVLALALWGYVAYQENPEMTRWIKNVPITIVGADELDESGYYVTGCDRTTVDVKLKGDRMSLARLTSDDITVKLDVSKIHKDGETTLSCDISTDKRDVEVSDSKHNSVVVSAEEIITSTFSVTPNIVGSPADGYQVFSPTASYDIVSVRGAKSIVEQVSSVSTKSVSVNGVTSGSTVTVGLTAFDKEGAAVSGVTFEPENVEVSYVIYKEKTVALNVLMTSIPINKDITASPNVITVYAPSEILENVSEIRTDQIDVSSVDNGQTYKVKLNLPDGVRMGSDVEYIDITFEVTDLNAEAEENE